MSLLRTTLSILLLGGCCAPVSADLVNYVFDFQGATGSELEGSAAGTSDVTMDFEGSPLTLRINASATGGNFDQGNGANMNFGIADSTFDAGESMAFSFSVLPANPNLNLKLSLLNLGNVNGSERALLTVNGTTQIFIPNNGSDDITNLDLAFAGTDSFTLAVDPNNVGNGFSLQSLTVQIASVPEPTAFLFGSLVAGCVGTVLTRRRSRRLA